MQPNSQFSRPFINRLKMVVHFQRAISAGNRETDPNAIWNRE